LYSVFLSFFGLAHVQPKRPIARNITKIANPQGMQYQRLKKFVKNGERFEHTIAAVSASGLYIR
jgi:fructose-1,6-bisphosphatase/sedoheptulose 1,7-bisphosphatase-like protein